MKSVEQPKSRTIQDVQNDYARMCANAGQLQYQIQELQKDLGMINARLRDLNLEGASIKEKEAVAKAAVEAAQADKKEGA